jgi:ribosomal-protein-alanine N-acetyltransferase
VTSDPPIELAAAADAQAIAQLSRALIEYGLPWGWTPERVLKSIRDADINVAVVRHGARLVGFGIMEYRDDDAHLVLFAVDAAHQRQGIGRTLLLWLEDSARAAGARRIRLESRRENVAGRSFYNELGYHEVRIRPGRYARDVDGVQLEKWLRQREEA